MSSDRAAPAEAAARATALRLARLAVITAAGYLVLQALLAAVLLFNHARGERPPSAALLGAGLPAGGFERVAFPAAGGATLRGELWGDAARRPLVVFGHGYRSLRRQGDPLAVRLLAEGYAVLLFDFRGSGASSGTFTGAGAIEGPDVRAALEFCAQERGVPARRTAYVGFSMGAAAALLEAEALSSLAAVVLIAPYARLERTFEARTHHFGGLALRPWFSPALGLFEALLGVDVRRVEPSAHAAAMAPAPLLLIGAAGDWRAPPADLEAILAAAGEPKQLLLLPEGDHFDLMRLGPPLQDEVLGFLRVRLPAAR